MSTMNHRQGLAMKRRYMRSSHAAPVKQAASSQAPVAQGAIQQAISMVANVQTVVNQIGAVKAVAGAAIYAARIREADRAARARQNQSRSTHWSRSGDNERGR